MATSKPKAKSKAGRTDAAPSTRAIRTDGWSNIWKALGRENSDKSLGATPVYERMSEQELDDLYASDDVAARIVDHLPQDALREWVEFKGLEKSDAAQILDTALDGISTAHQLETAWKWARLYGGAAILMVVDDGLTLDKPLDLHRVGKLNALTVLHRYELTPAQNGIDVDHRSPNFGKPYMYELEPRSEASRDASSSRIHYSRLIRFDGVVLSPRQTVANSYWGDSVLNRPYNAIRNFNVSYDAVACIMQTFNQPVIKMQGLADLLAQNEDGEGDGDKTVIARLKMIDLGRSVARLIALDKEDEFINVSTNLSGIPEVLDRISKRLVVSSGMPHTILLGESPSGLGATGRSEEKAWFDYVSSQQENQLRPKLARILEVLFASSFGPTRGQTPEGFAFEFKPLWQVSQKEHAEIREIQSRTDERYLATGVLDPTEVSMSRFGSGQFSIETQIDFEARKNPPPEPKEPDEGDDREEIGA